MKISKSQLEAAITEAIKELKNANDKHNCGSDRVKIYINENGELYHTIQQANWSNQGDTEILSFEYSRPDYNTEQSLLDENDFDGTIAEWDWDNFIGSSDSIDYTERLLEEAIHNCIYIDSVEVE